MKRENPLNPDSFNERNTIMSQKNIVKTLKISPEEYAVIRTKMEQSGMTFSRYVRTAAIEGNIYKLETPEYGKVMTELHRIGNIFTKTDVLSDVDRKRVVGEGSSNNESILHPRILF